MLLMESLFSYKLLSKLGRFWELKELLKLIILITTAKKRKTCYPTIILLLKIFLPVNNGRHCSRKAPIAPFILWQSCCTFASPHISCTHTSHTPSPHLLLAHQTVHPVGCSRHQSTTGLSTEDAYGSHTWRFCQSGLSCPELLGSECTLLNQWAAYMLLLKGRYLLDHIWKGSGKEDHHQSSFL